jgi:hypothetical protein
MRFMRTAENMDFSLPLEIKVFKDKEDEKTAIAFYQLDEKVPQKYTKENPGDCPSPTVKTVAKKKKWNWDEVMDFFYTQMTETVIPEIDRCYQERTGQEASSPSSAEEFSGSEAEAHEEPSQSLASTVSDDDIPF